MNTNSLQKFYDREYASEDWSALVLKPDAISTSRYDDIARLLRNEKGRLLDYGCGSGQLVLALADRFEHSVGIDLSGVRIDKANQVLSQRYPQYLSKIHFQRGDSGFHLPFKDESFDVVLACAVIEHVVDVFSVMDEIGRVCKLGGCVVLSVPNICYIKHVIALISGRVPLTGGPSRSISYWREHGWDSGHLHYFSKQTVTGLLEDVGFRPEEWSGDGKYAKLRRWYCNFVGSLTVRARKIR
jgi:ubiquinone/menaquinone biosynthesis C-methylase UbiE